MEVIADECVLDGKVFSLMWLNSQRLLACGSEGRMVSLNLDLPEGMFLLFIYVYQYTSIMYTVSGNHPFFFFLIFLFIYYFFFV